MNVEDILSLNPEAECEIELTFFEDWKHCYYQFKNKSNADIDPNKLPLLDKKYIGGTGEPLLNNDSREVYDPTQEIHDKLFYEVLIYEVFTSKTFIKILQKKVRDLISSGELSEDSDSCEVKEIFDMHVSWGPDSLGGSLLDGCKDLVSVKSKNEYDSLLWITASKLHREETCFYINEIK